jgi:hypothetical protein
MIKISYCWLHKVPVNLSDFNETWIFFTDYRKINIYLMKIHPFGTDLSRTDRGTDMTKLIVVFRSFANAPKSRLHLYSKLQLS